jgi:type I restriction enzyme S subunit
MSFPRYLKYKASGVEWLGEVPEHWEVKRIKDAASHNDDVLDETTPSDASFAYVDISGVEAGRGIVTTERVTFGTAPSRARRLVRDGDVIVSTVRTYLRAVARVQQPPRDLLVSTGFAVLRPRDGLDPEFLGFAAESSLFVDEVIARSTGVSYPAINASELVRVPLLLPPLAEQRAIAAFLDRETKKIDELVAEQERLIELLKEKRQAVISHAVTKGLDPAAPMKPSGVEWLGDVPAHWNVVPCRAIVNERNTRNDSGECVDYLSLMANIGIIPYEEKGDVGNKKPEDLTKCKLVRRGDFVINSMNYGIGSYGVSGLNGVCSPVYIVLTPIREVVEPRFAFRIFEDRAFQRYAQSFGNGILAHRCAIGWDTLKSISVPLPPRAEQFQILALLDSQASMFAALTAEAEDAIRLLRERRSALISAAVTGQIDVRNAVPSANPTEAA